MIDFNLCRNLFDQPEEDTPLAVSVTPAEQEAIERVCVELLANKLSPLSLLFCQVLQAGFYLQLVLYLYMFFPLFLSLRVCV